MSNEKDTAHRPSSTVRSQKRPAATLPLLAAATVLVLTIAGSIWTYRQGTRSLRVHANALGASHSSASTGPPESGDPRTVAGHAAQRGDLPLSQFLKQVDDWTLHVTMATAASGASIMLAAVVAVSCWRRALENRSNTARKEVWEEGAQKLEQLSYELHKRTN